MVTISRRVCEAPWCTDTRELHTATLALSLKELCLLFILKMPWKVDAVAHDL